MIAKGNTHNSGARLAAYMMMEKDGERAELVELRGFASEGISEAFRSVDAMALGTRSCKPMFHVAVRNPAGEHLTREQWVEVADRIESKLGFAGQPRALAFHISVSGDTHLHIGFSRIDPETMKLKCPAFYKLRLKEVCRELEARLGLTAVRNERAGKSMAPHRHEFEQARRLGIDISQTRAAIRECWERSDTGKSFQAALDGKGLRLVKGNRRAYLVMDEKGGVHALGQRILGVGAAAVKLRLSDLDRDVLPDLVQAREERVAKFFEQSRERFAPAVLNEVTKYRATFTSFDIERVLKPALADELARRTVVRKILEQVGVIKVDGQDGEFARYTLKQVIEAEQQVLRAANALAHRHMPSGPLQKNLEHLSQEQRGALEHIAGPEGIAIIEGQAGTGKSAVLAAGSEIFEAQGWRVVGLAHTNIVAQDLKEKGFSYAKTVDSELFALTKGRRRWTARTVVMVDEAAMLDTKRLGLILTHAQAAGAKVVLAGDSRQFSSIERGGMFELLKRNHGAAILAEVHRQQTTDERQASQIMAQGNFRAALSIYEAKGAIHWCDKPDAAAEALIDRYAADCAADPSKKRFIFAYTNDQVNELNRAARAVMARHKLLGKGSQFDTKHGNAEFAAGDLIQFTGTDKLRGIFNGQSGIVRAIEGSRIRIEIDSRDKHEIEFDAKQFDHFRHGYAGTIYRGQGRTIDQTYLLHSQFWRRASSYVALTRHSEKTSLFVARETAGDISQLARQMARLDERRAASYFVKGKEFGSGKLLSPTQLADWYAHHEGDSVQLRAKREEEVKAAAKRKRAALTSTRTCGTRRRGPERNSEQADSERRNARPNAFRTVGRELLRRVSTLHLLQRPHAPWGQSPNV